MNHTKRYIHKQHKDTNIIYIIKQDNCIYIYMLRIAGQTAGPIGLKFFVDTHGCPPPVLKVKNSKICFLNKDFFPRAPFR